MPLPPRLFAPLLRRRRRHRHHPGTSVSHLSMRMPVRRVAVAAFVSAAALALSLSAAAQSDDDDEAEVVDIQQPPAADTQEDAQEDAATTSEPRPLAAQILASISESFSSLGATLGTGAAKTQDAAGPESGAAESGAASQAWAEWWRSVFTGAMPGRPSSSERDSERNPLPCGHSHAFGFMTGDCVVVPGFLGSQLNDRATNALGWLSIEDLFVAGNTRKLAIPLHTDTDDQDPHVPTRLIERIGFINIIGRLVQELQDWQICSNGGFRVHPFPYDWRREPSVAADELLQYCESVFKLNGNTPITVIAHSMGGLVTLSAVNKRPEIFRGVVFGGTPFGPVPMLLWTLQRPLPVVINRDFVSPEFIFSARSAFIFLPRDGHGFCDASGNDILVDFFDPEQWAELGLARKLHRMHTQTEYDQAISYLKRSLHNAKEFHRKIAYDVDKGALYPRFALVVSDRWPTPTHFRAGLQKCRFRAADDGLASSQPGPDTDSFENIEASKDGNVHAGDSVTDSRRPPSASTVYLELVPEALQRDADDNVVASEPLERTEANTDNIANETSTDTNTDKKDVTVRKFSLESLMPKEISRMGSGWSIYARAPGLYLPAKHTHDLGVHYPSRFGAGDGLVPLASTAMPQGYSYATINTQSNHLTMLNDVDAIAQALRAVTLPGVEDRPEGANSTTASPTASATAATDS